MSRPHAIRCKLLTARKVGVSNSGERILFEVNINTPLHLSTPSEGPLPDN